MTVIPGNFDRRPGPTPDEYDATVAALAQRLFDVASGRNSVEVFDVIDEAQQLGSDAVVMVVQAAILYALAARNADAVALMKTGMALRGIRP
ncbi:hypothetical protein GCM10025864_39150 [Luteimicrobium album]|uniref:Uncharacterized protein n=1 Tax=Luteimicrobium album TaxID=1054550 RepID=A0ABQ6I5Z5_9MICO|nr:hypothetical protein [Luteimicrobium album]GMA26156.1 hypothetical protein GCM10025864_39150 [Luteimicrobium album]